MKNGFGGDFEGQVVRLGNGSAIGKADKLLKIVEGRGGVGISKTQHQLARRNTKCQGCMVFLDR